MKKVKIETERREANVQIIPVNASFIARTITALNDCEKMMILLQSCAPEEKENFKKNVCDFLKEMYDAFLAADED